MRAHLNRCACQIENKHMSVKTKHESGLPQNQTKVQRNYTWDFTIYHLIFRPHKLILLCFAWLETFLDTPDHIFPMDVISC